MPSNAGYKASAVSGYNITDIVYDLDATDPTLVDEITFNVSPISGSVAAMTVKLQTATGGVWTNCSLASGTLPTKVATCTYGSLALVDVTAVNVVASSSADPN